MSDWTPIITAIITSGALGLIIKSVFDAWRAKASGRVDRERQQNTDLKTQRDDAIERERAAQERARLLQAEADAMEDKMDAWRRWATELELDLIRNGIAVPGKPDELSH